MADVNGDLIDGQTSPSAGAISDGLDGTVLTAVLTTTSAMTSGATGSAGTIYHMRARDGTLGHVVFWSAGFIDDTGTAYTGPGPLTDVVVFKIVG